MPAASSSPATAVVLCGGRSRRFGADKLAQPLGSTTVLDTLLDSLPDGWPVVAVGSLRTTTRPVLWTVEQPAGGGPLAALAAGAALTHTAVVVVLAGDMPFAGPWAAAVADVLASNPGTEAVAARDATGRPNPLLAAYRADALVRALPADPAGRPARTLLDALPHTWLDVPDDDLLDVDTPERLEVARRRVDG